MGFFQNPNVGGLASNVTDVNGQTGSVTLRAPNIPYDPTTSGISATDVKTALDQMHVKPTNYIYVGKNGNDTTGDGSAGQPYLTIGKGITVASSGTTLFIFPGTYTENITFKAGVNLTSPAKFSVYITGNHTANYTGTCIVDGIILQSPSGTTLTFSGTGSQNLQILDGSSVNSTSGDAISWSNTNSSSRILFQDGTCNVSTSGASARCFYSTSTAKGSMIAGNVSFQINNPDNICLEIGGAVAFTHTQDVVIGQITASNTATYVGSIVTHTCLTQPVFTTTSSGMSVFMSCVDISTAQPIIAGTGGFSYAAIILGSTGKGNSSTLNGGLGGIPLDFAPIKFRNGTLRPIPLDGVMEYDGTDLYFTVSTTRYKVSLTTP